MTMTIEVPEENAARVQAAAEAQGIDLNTFAVAAVIQVAEDNALSQSAPFLSEVLAGRIGKYRSNSMVDGRLSERTGEKFAEGMVRKRDEERL